MQTIQIDNNLYDDIVKYGIDIQAELKNSIDNFLETKKSHANLNSKEFQNDKSYFQKSLADIESGKTKAISHDDIWKAIDKHTKVS